MKKLSAALAHSRFLPDLLLEVGPVERQVENLVVFTEPKEDLLWAQLLIDEAQILKIESIGDAVKKLKEHGKHWAFYSPTQNRRSQLILDQLPKYKIKPLAFRGSIPSLPMGFFSLLDQETLLLGAKTSSPFPLGEVLFDEDKVHPPSRAYLKLWELFTLHGICPQPGEKVLDFGACPGGWTWVLQQMGCHVVSVDKAPLAPEIMKLPRVEFKKCDAFRLKPEDVGPLDWFFSDIICYPPDLFDLVRQWLDSGLCSRFVCTIKFKGETDYQTLERFRRELDAKIVHLFHNKHEVTAIIQK